MNTWNRARQGQEDKMLPCVVGLTRQKDLLEELTEHKQEGDLEGYIKTLTYCGIELKFMRNKP